MKNLAGIQCDDEVREELRAAGIAAVPETWPQRRREPITGIMGQHGGWTFHRAWYYWSARGPAIPIGRARVLWESWGEEIRWGGDCGCRCPVEDEDGYPDTGSVHIDTEAGLLAFRRFLDGEMPEAPEATPAPEEVPGA